VDFRNGFNATGEVRLIGIKIGDDLNCRNAKLVNTPERLPDGILVPWIARKSGYGHASSRLGRRRLCASAYGR
jgi:hypothetical protein